jgi:hypothetical protein
MYSYSGYVLQGGMGHKKNLPQQRSMNLPPYILIMFLPSEVLTISEVLMVSEALIIE